MDGLGERLRARIRQLGLTDAEVSRRAGLSETRLAHYVRDRREPDFATFIRICRLLATSPNEMLDFDGTNKSPPENANLLDVVMAAAAGMDATMLRTAAAVMTTMAQQGISEP